MASKPKKAKKLGCEHCPWGDKKAESFVSPEYVDNPDVLILAEAPGRTELLLGKPLIGKSGNFIREILRKYSIKAVLFNSAQCYDPQKPSRDVLKVCKSVYVNPILEKYPEVPLVCLGEFAASTILGGRRNISSIVGKAIMLNNREVYFTYHPAYYIYTHNPVILESIDTVIFSAAKGKDIEVKLEWKD